MWRHWREREREREREKKYVLHFFPKTLVSGIFFLWWNFANYLRGIRRNVITRRNVIGLCGKWSLFLSDFNQKLDWINKFQVKVSSTSVSWKSFLNFSCCDKKPDRRTMQFYTPWKWTTVDRKAEHNNSLLNYWREAGGQVVLYPWSSENKTAASPLVEKKKLMYAWVKALD